MSGRNIDFPLVSNGFTLDKSPQRLGWLTSSDPGLPMPELREIYRAQGYLWLQGILPRQRVYEYRRRYFNAFKDIGMLQADSDPVEGVFSGVDVDRAVHNKIMMTLIRSAAYESFCLMNEIWQFYEAFLGGDPYLHKRKITRHIRPLDKNCTGAHYDLVYLRGGTDNVCTSWIPIGNIPVELGGLVYLEGSDSWGRKTEAEFQEKAKELSPEERLSAYNRYMDTSGWITKDLPALAERTNLRWLAADYEAGDMVIHSPYMVHASTMNVDPDGHFRLSTDIRYQRVQDEIDARWQNHLSYDDML